MAISLLVLVLATAVAFYILVGYPILLASSFRTSRPPVGKNTAFQPTVSILLAVHNGERFVKAKLECLLALRYPKELMEVLVVSDGSTDATDSIVESFSDRGVRLLRVPQGGKSAALSAAFQEVTGEVVFLTDVRQALDRDALAHLAANFADPTVGAVTGELRYCDLDGQGGEADLGIYWRYELWARRRHAEIDSACNTTGCIYAIRRLLAGSVPSDTLTDDLFIPLRAHCSGYRVIVDPKAVAYDSLGIEGGEFRRKVRTLGGLWQVHLRLPALFTRANRMRWHFLSHKSSRLVLPWLILIILTATLALPPSAMRSFLLWDELVLPFLAAIDCFVPKHWAIKRISSPARSFLALNAASLLSAIVFVVPARSLWRPTRVKDKQEHRFE